MLTPDQKAVLEKVLEIIEREYRVEKMRYESTIHSMRKDETIDIIDIEIVKAERGGSEAAYSTCIQITRKAMEEK